MQADFGLAQAVVAGSRTDVHCLVVSFPYSNMRYAVALPGENAECVCEGLLGVFEHIGAVPPVLVPGRRHRRGAPGLVGRDRGGGGVPEVRRASPDRGRVSAIRARAARRAARGNAVGFLRRNVMVPLPNAESHAQPAAVHALQVRPDRRGSPLPQGRAGQGPVRAGSGGDGPDAWNPVRRVPVGGAQGRRRGMRGRGLASVSRGSVVARVDARRRAARSTRGIRTRDGRRVGKLPRAYGGDTGTVRDPAVLLPALARKPRAWGESPIRVDFPDRLRLSHRRDGVQGVCGRIKLYGVGTCFGRWWRSFWTVSAVGTGVT